MLARRKSATEIFGPVFQRMKGSCVMGVPGVVCIDSKKPGQVLGITACTHGNEPSGVAVIGYLLDTFNIGQRLKAGKLFLVINNIRAFEMYLRADDRDDAELRIKSRSVDSNMNRLPPNLAERTYDMRYEIERARALLPIWRQFDVGFDIHSTSQPSDPMIITGNDIVHWSLMRGFPIRIVLSNIDAVQVGMPVFGFFGKERNTTPVFEIESGQHDDPKAHMLAIECAIALLKNMRMVEGETEHVIGAFDEYRVVDSVRVPDCTYSVSRVFPHFESVQKGTVLARSSDPEQQDIVMPFDGTTVFCPSDGVIRNFREEAMFLTLPVRPIVNA